MATEDRVQTISKIVTQFKESWTEQISLGELRWGHTWFSVFTTRDFSLL